MIKINSLTQEERTVLETNVENFYPMYSKQVRFKTQLKSLKEICKIKCDKELWTYITAISKAIRYGNTKTYMSFDAKIYNLASHHTKHPINCQKMVEIAKILEDTGHLIKYLGYKSDSGSSLSILVFTTKLLDLFDEDICKNFGAVRDLSFIEMYDTTYKVDDSGKEFKHKELISLKGKVGYGYYKQGLAGFNKVIASSTIIVNGEVRNDILYKRVFEKTFYWAGRFYTFGSFQSLSKVERNTIEINGSKTYSEDYEAIHPNIIRTWKGITIPATHDPYTINFSKECNLKELRSLCKVGLMCLLYNRSRGKAIQALTQKITKDKKNLNRKKNHQQYSEPKYKSLHKYRKISAEIIDKLTLLNSDIAEEFFQEDLWYRLQGEDAKIAEYVIRHFTDKGIAVLPWHDSFRVDIQYKDELKAIMREAWVNVLGNLTHCHTSEE